MLRFFAEKFLAVTHNLEMVREMLMTVAYVDAYANASLDWSRVDSDLQAVEDEIKKLPTSLSLQKQAERLQKRARRHDSGDLEPLITIITELLHNVHNELESHLFFVVPAQLKDLYLHPELILGEVFESAFPDAVKDAHNGIRCYVLDQWTASVFHFMRTLEHGLRWLPEKVGLDIKDISLENWKNIIDRIVKKINEMEQLTKSQQKSEDIKFYSEAATNFRFFKDAWRNHVSHARVTYDSDDARRIMDHVLEFMKHLATRV